MLYYVINSQFLKMYDINIIKFREMGNMYFEIEPILPLVLNQEEHVVSMIEFEP